MSEIIGAFLCGEIGNGATDPTPEARNRMLGRLAQMRLEFAEGQLDRVEVRRILRKIISVAPAASIASATPATLWTGRWSIQAIWFAHCQPRSLAQARCPDRPASSAEQPKR